MFIFREKSPTPTIGLPSGNSTDELTFCFQPFLCSSRRPTFHNTDEAASHVLQCCNVAQQSLDSILMKHLGSFHATELQNHKTIAYSTTIPAILHIHVYVYNFYPKQMY